MMKPLFVGAAIAAVAGALIGLVNASLGGPAWLTGGIAGFVGAGAVALAMKTMRKDSR